MCVAILVLGTYVWANYLRLEHYLLVPWLIVAIGAAVAVEGVATGLSRLVVRVGLGSDRAASRVGTIVGLVVLAFAVTLGGLNFAAVTPSR